MFLRLFLTVFIGFCALPAMANPFYIGRFDGLKAGPANSGAFAVYWNPAGLAQGQTLIHLHTLVVNRHATFDRYAEENNVPPELTSINAGENTTGSTGVVPALAMSHGLTLGQFDLGFGLASFIDRAGKTNWRKNFAAPSEVPGAIDGPQRWSTINTNLLILSTAMGFGLKYNPWRLSVGVTPIYNYAQLSTVRARNPDGGERVVDESGRLAEGRILFDDGEGSGLGWVAGLRWEPSDEWLFGLAWHTGVSYEIKGQAHLTFGRAEESNAPAAFELPVPHTVRAEAAIEIDSNLVIRPQLSWAQWSIFKEQKAINTDNGEVVLNQARDFEDVFAYRIALDWTVSDTVVLHASGQFETGATPIATFEPGLAESNNWELGAGTTVEVADSVSAGISFTWQQFEDAEVRNSVQKPLMNGFYTDRRHYLSLDLEFEL
jgi:long-chain fatty acid transport protein